MITIYIDDSIHERGNFITCGVVITENPRIDNQISDSLVQNGYDSDKDEFKSGLSFIKHPKMLMVRKDLKYIITSSCKIGLIILPSDKRQFIGEETLKGLKSILDSNNLKNDLTINIDENYFKSKKVGLKYAQDIGLPYEQLNLEVDSRKTKGIQLADIVAHTCATMLLEKLNLIDKKVKAGQKSGYDPDTEIEIGFELWASIRYNFLGVLDDNFLNGIGDPIKITEPYGLYISEYCNEILRKNIKERFSKIYMGCIH